MKTYALTVEIREHLTFYVRADRQMPEAELSGLFYENVWPFHEEHESAGIVDSAVVAVEELPPCDPAHAKGYALEPEPISP